MRERFKPRLLEGTGLNKEAFIIAVAVLFSLPIKPARADIYQYVDDSGVMHFTNVNVERGKKYKKLKSEPRETPASLQPRTAPPAPVGKVSSYNIPSDYLRIIDAACDRHGVDPALVHAIIKVESDFNPYALSRKGAMGLMQLMPQTAVDLNVRNSFNPDENIDGGVKYLRYLIDRYEGNLSLALAAYNAGESAIRRWGTVPPFKETQDYVQRILRLYNGKTKVLIPRYTIYVGYDQDGALLLTDNPSNHPKKALKRKTGRNL